MLSSSLRAHDGLDVEVDRLTAALAITPHDYSLVTQRAHRWYELGRLDRAEDDLDYADGLLSGNVNVLMLRATIAVDRGRDHQALAFLHAVLEQTPSSAALRARGALYERRGELAQAMADYQMAMEHHPSVEVALCVGRVASKLGHWDAAIYELRQALAVIGPSTMVQLALVAALEHEGRFAAALGELNALRTHATMHGAVDLRRARALRGLGLDDQARQVLSQAIADIDERLRVRPSAALHVLRARVLLELGQRGSARAAAVHALRLAPRYPDAQRLAIKLGAHP